MWIANSCASGKLSSKLVGYPPLYIYDRWSGPKFNRPGFTMTSKSNSWNRRRHRQIFPQTLACWLGTLDLNDLCTFWNVHPTSNVGTSEVYRPYQGIVSFSWCNLFPVINSFLLAKEMGWLSAPSPGCLNTMLSMIDDALTWTWNSFFQYGNTSIGAMTILFFNLSKLS